VGQLKKSESVSESERTHSFSQNSLTLSEPARIINTALNNLMGKVDRYFSNLNQRKESGFRKSLEYFERAVNADPDYALAYAGLADAWFLLTWYRYYPGPEGYEKAKEYALQDWVILFRNFEI
jgi:hypothetical protein